MASYTFDSISTKNEGDTVYFTGTTSGVADGTKLYFKITGNNINSDDIYSNWPLEGSSETFSNGKFQWSSRLANDQVTEGTENITIELYSDSSRTNKVASTSFNVLDSSNANASPTYSLTTSASTINEGDSFTTTVNTTNVTAGTTLYWGTYSNDMVADDFDINSPLNGSGTVGNDGTFTFSQTLSNDQLTEGSESFALKLFSDSSRNNQLGDSLVITVLDTSNAVPTYSLTTSASTINEGDSFTTTVNTTNVTAGTTLYWGTYSDDMVADDFDINSPLNGSGTVGNDGTFTFSQTLSNDQLTEGSESFALKLFSDSSRNNQLGDSLVITVLDTSNAVPTYSLTTSASTINEGDSYTTFIRTKNVDKETTLYWSISGNGINSNDFSSGALTGSGKVDNYGSFNFRHTLLNDFIKEGNETATITLYSDANRTQQVATTSLLIKDTSADDFSSDINTSGRIDIGSEKSGEINFNSDQDWLKVSLTQGKKYQFDCTSNSQIDPYLYLRDQSGQYLSFDDNGGNDQNARITYTANSTASFFLEIGDIGQDNTGSYTLSAKALSSTDDYEEDTNTSGEIIVGGKVTGEIESQADRDWFVINLTKGHQYEFKCISTDIDSDLFIRNAEGEYLKNSNGLLSYTATETGRHFLDLGDKGNNDIGLYEITASKINTSNDDYTEDINTNGLITIGDFISTKLDVQGDRDWFKVNLTKNITYQFDVVESNSIDPYLYLRNAQGNSLIYDNDSGSGDDARILFTPISSGNYFLSVGDIGENDIGEYRIYAQSIASSQANYSSINGYGSVSAAKAFEQLLDIDLIPRPNYGGNLWGLDNIDAQEVWQGSHAFAGTTGDGAIVAVLDTGIDIDHQEFTGKIVSPWDFVNNDSIPEDHNGHGTHVAGTIAALNNGIGITGVAYNAKIMPLKVLGKNKNGDIDKAIRYAVDNGADVINMSLGNIPPYHNYTDGLLNAIKYASDNNVVCIMAAGNGYQGYLDRWDGFRDPAYPARWAEFYGMAVGADNINKLLTYWSDRAGPTKLDYVTAPGHNIYSCWSNGGYKIISGTSMAAPHVAGIATLLKSYDESLTASQIENLITSTGSNQKVTSSNDGIKTIDIVLDNNLIEGTINNDTLKGSSGDDVINGSEGNDSIISTQGSDEIDGGAGKDKIIFSGNFNDYTITREVFYSENDAYSVNELSITDNRKLSNNGKDRLKNIELIEFSDQTVEEAKVDVIKTYSGKFSDYKFYNKGNSIYQIKTDSGYDDITGLPLLTFTEEAATSSFRDVSAIADIKGTFDQVTGLNTDDAKMFRLYNASFKRLPDPDGLKYWIGKYTSGENDERAVASSFLISEEFKGLYGDDVSDTAYVNNLYNNVLGRNADGSGLNYWLGQLDSGAETRYEVLLGFSESAENKTLFTEMTGLS